MKTFLKLFAIATAVMSLNSCMKYDFDVDYQSPVTIGFEGVGSDNIYNLAKGVDSYTAKIDVSAAHGLSYFEIYTANSKTGAAIEVVEGSQNLFTEGQKSYSTTYLFENLNENAAIQISVSDTQGNTVVKNLVVTITPSVNFSDEVIAETYDVYYGVYYASWLSGRVYMRSSDNVASYAKAVDLAFGEVPTGEFIEPAEGDEDSEPIAVTVPCVLSPASRSEYGLLNLANLPTTLVAATTLSSEQYRSVTRTDSSLIDTVAEPTDKSAELKAGTVYAFKLADGRKGLMLLNSVAQKSATVEVAADKWEKRSYHQISFSTKVVE